MMMKRLHDRRQRVLAADETAVEERQTRRHQQHQRRRGQQPRRVAGVDRRRRLARGALALDADAAPAANANTTPNKPLDNSAMRTRLLIPTNLQNFPLSSVGGAVRSGVAHDCTKNGGLLVHSAQPESPM